jgi:hypothetical protein
LHKTLAEIPLSSFSFPVFNKMNLTSVKELDMVAYACNLSCLGGREQEDCGSGQPGKSLARPCLNKQAECGGSHL